MSKQFMSLKAHNPDHRLQLLKDNCDKTEETKYYKDLSPVVTGDQREVEKK